MNKPLFSVVSLSDLAVIKITGADALDFLHGQLTQDITGLVPGQARLAGYCTPKGRLLASLVIWRDLAQPDELQALVKADIAQALVKRLSMFVLRAKVKLAIEPHAVLGVTQQISANSQAQAVDTAQVTPNPPGAGEPWSVAHTADGTWVQAPGAASHPRWWLITPEQQIDPAASSNELAAAWQAADIAAGLPWIEAATQDIFIPQTLNFDLIAGVHFTKGCYPGQEVVARSHYRGTIKRRMAYGVANSDGSEAPAAGTDIFDAARPDTPSGRVVNAAVYNGQTHLLLEVHLSDLNAAQYRLNSAQGAPIGIQPLPYRIDTAKSE